MSTLPQLPTEAIARPLTGSQLSPNQNDQLAPAFNELNLIMKRNDVLAIMSKKEKYTEEYNSSMKKISEMKDRIYLEYNHIVQHENKDWKYPFFHDLDKLMAEWSKLEDYIEHNIAHDKFLIPLQKLCRDTQPDHNAFIILGLSNDCIYALNNLTALKSFIKDAIDFKAVKLQKVEENMTAFRAKYEQKKK